MTVWIISQTKKILLSPPISPQHNFIFYLCCLFYLFCFCSSSHCEIHQIFIGQITIVVYVPVKSTKYPESSPRSRRNKNSSPGCHSYCYLMLISAHQVGYNLQSRNCFCRFVAASWSYLIKKCANYGGDETVLQKSCSRPTTDETCDSGGPGVELGDYPSSSGRGD